MLSVLTRKNGNRTKIAFNKLKRKDTFNRPVQPTMKSPLSVAIECLQIRPNSNIENTHYSGATISKQTLSFYIKRRAHCSVVQWTSYKHLPTSRTDDADKSVLEPSVVWAVSGLLPCESPPRSLAASLKLALCSKVNNWTIHDIALMAKAYSRCTVYRHTPSPPPRAADM